VDCGKSRQVVCSCNTRLYVWVGRQPLFTTVVLTPTPLCLLNFSPFLRLPCSEYPLLPGDGRCNDVSPRLRPRPRRPGVCDRLLAATPQPCACHRRRGRVGWGEPALPCRAGLYTLLLLLLLLSCSFYSPLTLSLTQHA
jgi:hypothetical protein